jgi:16S rRNA (cytidine1402-2'-O)-methyltransferase
MSKAVLYLIPTTLGSAPMQEIFPEIIKEIVSNLTYFIVENEKSARKFIKEICPEKKQSEIIVYQLNKHNKQEGIDEFIKPLLQGNDIGLLSEAGLPAIADPGSLVVASAHKNQIKVKPLTGPSSLMLALMASGLNGQKFSFEGYLPKESGELKRKIKFLEQLSAKEGSAKICIETPYRNNKLLDSLLKYLHPQTRLCIACDLTTETEFIKTLNVYKWKQQKPDLHKRPAVFIFQAE